MSDFYDQRSKHRVGKVKAAVLVFDRVYFRGNGTERQENGVVVSVCYQRGFFEKTFLLSVRSAFFPTREVAYIKIGVQISRFQRKLALSVRDTEVKRGRNQVEGEIFQILRVDDCFELCVDVERPEISTSAHRLLSLISGIKVSISTPETVSASGVSVMLAVR